MSKIQVEPNSLTPLVSTLTQRALIGLLGYFGASGFLSDDEVSKLASAIIAFGLVVWGAWRSYRSNEEKKRMEPYAPNAELKNAPVVKSPAIVAILAVVAVLLVGCSDRQLSEFQAQKRAYFCSHQKAIYLAANVAISNAAKVTDENARAEIIAVANADLDLLATCEAEQP
jgi:hypothetical protein